MPLETDPKFPVDLNPAWPLGTDPKSEGDNHIRNLKVVWQSTFPGVSAPFGFIPEYAAAQARRVARVNSTGQLATWDVPDGYRLEFPLVPSGLSGLVIDLDGDSDYQVVFDDLRATVAGSLYAQTSNDGGQTWHSGASAYINARHYQTDGGSFPSVSYGSRLDITPVDNPAGTNGPSGSFTISGHGVGHSRTPVLEGSTLQAVSGSIAGRTAYHSRQNGGPNGINALLLAVTGGGTWTAQGAIAVFRRRRTVPA